MTDHKTQQLEQYGSDYEITEDDLGEEDVKTGWWNYRVFVEDVPEPTPENPSAAIPWYTLRDTYYDHSGKVWGYGNPETICGESIDDLKQQIEWMRLALDKPVLNIRDIPVTSFARDLGEV